MKRFITALILFTVASASAAFEIVRSGNIIVAKDQGKYCYPLDLGQIDGALPNGSYSLISALTSIINYEFIVTDEHRALCGVSAVGETELVWRVAKNGTATTRPAKLLVTDSNGVITREKSTIRVTVGTDCAGDDVAGYVAPSTGSREWRNPIDAPTIAVICEQVEVVVAGAPAGDFSAGFNFRQNAGYVTDTVGNTFAGAGVLYSDSVGYGWVDTAPDFRDRLSNVPPELAGVAHADNNGVQHTFRIDLPATGIYSIRLAMGDARRNQENVFVQVFDGDTLIIQTMDEGGIDLPAGVFIDASGIARETPADWVENNRPFVYAFQTKIMRIVLGAPTAIDRISVLSHVSVSN